MAAKNVLQKHWNGTEWVEIHPVTKASNVFTAGGQTIEQTFDAHNTDNTRHITATERAAWNAKETPAGAQAKANAARDGAISTANSHTDSQHPTVANVDTRNDNQLPSWYSTPPRSRQLHNEFKSVATIGLTGVGGTYCTVITDARWGGTSGGNVTQVAICDGGRMFRRHSTSNHAAWSDWTEHETTAGAQLKIDHASYKVAKSNKDAEGVFTTVEYRRKSDETLAVRSVLSGGTSPQYTTRTVTFYAANGTTVSRTDTFALSYDTDGVLVSEV